MEKAKKFESFSREIFSPLPRKQKMEEEIGKISNVINLLIQFLY